MRLQINLIVFLFDLPKSENYKKPRCTNTTGLFIYHYFTNQNLAQWGLRPTRAATQNGRVGKPRSVPSGASKRCNGRNGNALRRFHR
jgi:hypothetical protein